MERATCGGFGLSATYLPVMCIIVLFSAFSDGALDGLRVDGVIDDLRVDGVLDDLRVDGALDDLRVDGAGPTIGKRACPP